MYCALEIISLTLVDSFSEKPIVSKRHTKDLRSVVRHSATVRQPLTYTWEAPDGGVLYMSHVDVQFLGFWRHMQPEPEVRPAMRSSTEGQASAQGEQKEDCKPSSYIWTDDQSPLQHI